MDANDCQTRPEFKLPALYLLDSLVKNVGTPYTVYLSRNLYRTFFDTFTVVDIGTRRALEELFESWKQPVPLSRDPRPVFPPEVTQSIDASLIKIRALDQKSKQEEEQARLNKARMAHLPSRLNNGPPRQTPTPTGGYPYQPPPIIGQNSNPNSEGIAAMMSGFNRVSTPNYNAPNVPAPAYGGYPSPARPPPNQQYPYPQQNGATITYSYSGPPPPTMSHQQRLDKLRADVQGLITSAQAHLSRNPYDGDKQKLLQNLTSLKVLLDGGQLSLAHIQGTEIVVANIAKQLPPPPPPPASAPPLLAPGLIASLLAGSTPQPTPPQPYAPQQYAPLPHVSTPQFAPAIPATPSQGAPPVSMAQVMALLNPSTPALSSATPAVAAPPTNSLLDQLRASGLLGGTSTLR